MPSSYLSVDLSQEFRDFASALAQSCVAAADASGLDFEPMQPDDVHMTFFFLGEGVSKVKRLALEEFRAELVELCARYQICRDFAPLSVVPFPPGKGNLLAMTCADPVGAQQLHAAVGKAACRMLGADAVRNPSPWLPHVTLGKFRFRDDTDRAAFPRTAASVATAVSSALGGAAGLTVAQGGFELCEPPHAALGIDWSSIAMVRRL